MLDTKSKSSKKFSYLLAGALVAAATAVFLAFYPAMGEQADYHFSDYLKSDQFLFNLYEGNLVLNKQMLDKTRQTEISYSDLYLTAEYGEVPETEMGGDGAVYQDEMSGEYIKSQLGKAMEDVMEGWESSVLGSFAQEVDYCVIDHRTGEMMKNTGRDIDALYTEKKGKTGEKAENDYVYYVMMTYDDAGSVSNISVRDENSDELLKKVQSAMANKWLRGSFMEAAMNILQYQDAVYYYNETGTPEKLVWHVNDRPKNMTFIYALTGEQKEHILKMAQNGSLGGQFYIYYRWEVQSAYYEAGTPGIYWLILVILGILALICTRIKGYCLHTLPAFQVHMEVALTAIFIVLGAGIYFIIQLIYFTNGGYFPEVYSKYMGIVPEAFYPVLTEAINAAVLFLLFGIWYYLITSFGQMFDIGIKEFIRRRSLIVIFVRWLAGGCKRRTNQLKEEVLHADLGGKTEKTIVKILAVNFVVLAAVCTMWVGGYAALIIYTFAVYFVIKKYVDRIKEQYRKLFIATRSIAEGNLQTELLEDWGVFESYKEELSKIQNGFKAAVDKEVKSQRMKTELITNVSHDLKTPLTAITTYIELLEDENLTPEVRKEYLEVLKKKSERLKFLIEDLFEVSRASSGNVTLNLVDVDICNLMRQVYLEYEDRVEEADLIFRFRMPEEKVTLRLDSQKTYRVFENLYVNIIKYAMPHTRVYVNAEKTKKGVLIELKNMSASELNIQPEELTERFVRGDSARNTEGSGLGLAIARSFVELQGGKLAVEIDGDLFKVLVVFATDICYTHAKEQ
ncbi:MAG: HAMP domain-containing histidine kinase [Lachnospiraceae bacterium]|nr:HAMP domain-containing histidine kinase [Lachnospiraceae bacterium]